MKKKIIFALTYFAATVSLVSCNEAKSVESITASTSQTTYNVGDVISKKDIIVEATYDNKYKQNVSSWQCDDFTEDNLNMYTFTAEDGSKKEKTFKINYLDKTVSYSIKVSAPKRVTKSEWLDEYESIKAKFEAETLEYTILNIESIFINTKNYPANYFTCSYSGTGSSRIFTIYYNGTPFVYASTYMEKSQLGNNLPDDTTEGAFYEVYDNYINYVCDTYSGGYKRLSFSKSGYLINQKTSNNTYKINYKGELKPKTLTKTEWISKYKPFSQKFDELFETKRYTKANPITISGYVGDSSGHLYEAQLYNYRPFVYADDDSVSNVKTFKCNLNVLGSPSTQLLGGYGYNYYYIDSYLLSTLESAYYVEYYFDETNQKAQVAAYDKVTSTLMINIVFNSNGYVERFYNIDKVDLYIDYNGDPIEKIENYAITCTVYTDPVTQKFVDGGYGFIEDGNSLTLKNGITYRFSLVNQRIDATIGTIPVHGHFGVKKLRFTGSSSIVLSDAAKDFKVFLNNKEVSCSASKNEIIIDSEEITTINSDVVFEFTMTSDTTVSTLSSAGGLYE